VVPSLDKNLDHQDFHNHLAPRAHIAAALRGHSWSIPLTNRYTQTCRSTSQQHQSLSNTSERLSRHQHRVEEQTLRGISALLPSQPARGVSSTPSVDPSPCQRSMRVLFTWRLPSILEWPRCLCAQRGGPRRVLLRFITISNFSLSPWILIGERKMNRVFIMQSPCRQAQH
jgi:hypothetical protein